eukprot:1150148-Pelagomonas_calceolata.AAC.3
MQLQPNHSMVTITTPHGVESFVQIGLAGKTLLLIQYKGKKVIRDDMHWAEKQRSTREESKLILQVIAGTAAAHIKVY